VQYCLKLQLMLFEVNRGQSDDHIDLLSAMRKVLVSVLSTTCDVDLSPVPVFHPPRVKLGTEPVLYIHIIYQTMDRTARDWLDQS
jgi:hypothetical protein